jgi:hypothetical protein
MLVVPTETRAGSTAHHLAFVSKVDTTEFVGCLPAIRGQARWQRRGHRAPAKSGWRDQLERATGTLNWWKKERFADSAFWIHA